MLDYQQKVVKISNGTAVVDAGGAKEVSSKLWRIWNQVITSWSTPELQSQRSPMKMKARPISLWRNCCNGRTKKQTAREIIENYDGPAVRIMEVCGTHTHEIFRLGIENFSKAGRTDLRTGMPGLRNTGQLH